MDLVNTLCAAKKMGFEIASIVVHNLSQMHRDTVWYRESFEFLVSDF